MNKLCSKFISISIQQPLMILYSTVYNYNKYIKRSFTENSTFLTFSFFDGGWKNTKSVSGKIVLQ